MSEIDQRQTEQKPAQEFAIITKAKDLVKHTFMMTSERRFPKKYRFTIVNRLHDLTLDIFQHIQDANDLTLQTRRNTANGATNRKGADRVQDGSFPDRTFL